MTVCKQEYQSYLSVAPDEVWSRVTSVEGVNAELWPLARMTFPPGIDRLPSEQFEPGRMLARSWVLLFGVLPIDWSELTLVSFRRGVGPGASCGFVEESPMLSMRQWRHERVVEAAERGTCLTDRLAFEPRLFGPVVRAFVSILFHHRHKVLRRQFGGTPG